MKQTNLKTSITTLVVAWGLAMLAPIAVAANGGPPSPPALWLPGDMKGSYLGVDINEITKDRVTALKLKDEHGVEITMVDQDAPAGKAGLKEHDVILEFNGTRVEGEEQLKRLIHETPAGRQVTLGVSREGQAIQIPVTLAERRKVAVWNSSSSYPRIPAISAKPIMPEIPEMPDMPDVNVLVRSYSVTAGMMVDNLTPQLGEFFGVKSGEGVLVRSVEKGSAAEASGLKAGDVIVKVDDEKISDRSDWRRALRQRKSGKVSLGIVREKHDHTLTLTLPEPNKNDSRNWKMPGSSDTDVDMDFDISGLREMDNPMGQFDIESVLQSAHQVSAERFTHLRPKINAQIELARKQLQEALNELNAELQPAK